jgi:nicotinamide mononucleotide transporter
LRTLIAAVFELVNNLLRESWIAPLEWIIFVLQVIFILLLMFEHIACWFFGIVASVLSIFIFLHPSVYLPAEAVLYLVYVVLGIYGWYRWQTKGTVENNPIVKASHRNELLYFLFSVGLTLVIAAILITYTKSNVPWLDAVGTAFAFMATFTEAKKIKSCWWYWIFINFFSAGLYYYKNLEILSIMMLFFGVLSIAGLLQWERKYRVQQTES